MTEVSDEQLVGAFLARRSEADFRELYRRRTPLLFRVASRMLRGNEADARDVVQETWLRASHSLPRFAGRSTFRTWLIGIAVNVCREWIRKRDRGREDPTDLEDAALFSEGSSSMRVTGTRIDLERSIAGLADGYREVLILHDIEGFTHQEIGEMLGTETGTSKSQLSRASSVADRTRQIWSPLMNDEDREVDLSELKTGPTAPGELEDATVERLRRAGAFAGGNGKRPPFWFWSIAASILLFVAGLAVGRGVATTDPGTTDPGTETTSVAVAGDYILLLREPADRSLADSLEGGLKDGLYEEYARWARDGSNGAVISGERLGSEIHRLYGSINTEPVGETPSPSSTTIVSGFFVIRADSIESAMEIARDCPHYRHGGGIEVRRLDRQ